MSSDADTGPSDVEGNDNDDSQFGMSQLAAITMDIDPAGPDEANNLGEEERVAEVVQADLAAATLASLVVYGRALTMALGRRMRKKRRQAWRRVKRRRTRPPGWKMG